MFTTMNHNQGTNQESQQLIEIRKKLEQMELNETLEQPRMIQAYVEGRTYQTAFCFAAAFDYRGGREPFLLATVIGGADSTVQSIKAVMDTGTYGLQLGYGVKGLSSYNFHKEMAFFTEKGKYSTIAMTIGNRKALAIVHQDILDGKYTMSFEQNPAEDIRKVLGGSQFGLPLLEEWAEPIYTELMLEGYLTKMPLYYDKGVFQNGFHVIRFDLDEEQADDLVSKMIVNKEILFPTDVEGTGEKLEEIEDLTSYMENFNEDLITKLSNEVKPGYNPLVDKPYKIFDTYATQLFPVQAHVASAMAKRLGEGSKSVINQGEMSTGKSKMMTAIVDAYLRDIKKVSGYFSVVMVPPSLTDKWSTQEIYDLIPNALVIMIKKTSELVEYHQNWIKQGRPKPLVPTFFVISFTTMRSGSAIEPAVEFESIKTSVQKSAKDVQPYRFGYICSDCGKPHQVIESRSFEFDQDGNEVVKYQKRMMVEDEFGVGRRVKNSNRPANAFCSECGSSLWTNKVPNRYKNFKEWSNNVEKPLHAAINAGDKIGVTNILKNQPAIPKQVGKPRRVATIEYIRRKMKGFFDICIIDELHMLKSGDSAQGNALGSLVSASKKCVAGTGTLFGGKAEDIYYIMWKLFPSEMVKAGFAYENVQQWNEMYGNIERTTYNNNDDDSEQTNKQSRGGRSRTTVKVKPGISPFVFGRFLVQNTCLVRLLDVWPDPIELVDVPTVLVDMNEEQQQAYNQMKLEFESEIEANRFRKEDNIPNLWLLYTETGISYLDNPGRYPEVYGKQKDGKRKLLWEPTKLNIEKPLPKEQKLIEIISGEISENRPSIIYVRDTGTSKEERDIQPRLKEVLEQHVPGAKVAILRSNTTDTDKRTKWLNQKIEKEGVNVVICSMKLVEVGLDLLKTPTLIFYQFSWSMFTMNQAARRAWRIGQLRECRLYYLAYKDSFQEQMATLIAQKNRASQAINGSVSSGEGLSAMLGDSGDLQEMLIKSIKDGETLKGSTEEWIATTTDRAREILNGIGKKKENVGNETLAQLLQWARKRNILETTMERLQEKQENIIENIKLGKINGFRIRNGELVVDEVLAFGFDFFTDSDLISHLLAIKPKHVDLNNFEIKVVEASQTKGKKNKVVDGQLAIDLFSDF